MPQVSNLSWIWTILIFVFLYLALIFLISYFNFSTFKKNFYSLESKISFFFLI